MSEILLLDTPPQRAADKAMRIVREYIDGWYLVRHLEIPLYDLFVDRLRFRESDGNWTAYVQPAGNPQTEFKIHYLPKVGKLVLMGGPLIDPIVFNRGYFADDVPR